MKRLQSIYVNNNLKSIRKWHIQNTNSLNRELPRGVLMTSLRYLLLLLALIAALPSSITACVLSVDTIEDVRSSKIVLSKAHAALEFNG